MRFKIISILCLSVIVSMPLVLLAADDEKSAPESARAAMDVQPGVSGDDYVIGSGDVLDIALWRDDALMRQVVVLADGRISFPLAGEVMAAGKTIAELKKEMAARLTDYVPEPVLSIEVKQPNSMVIYVTGRVNSPNRFPINGNLTIMQALSTAGGLNPFAKRNKIKVLRQEGDETKIFRFKYDEVVDGKNLEQNITLKRGDVVVVP